ncbi:MAG: DUF2061 domain-containing protein [Bacteroidota bacterium]
MHEQHHRSLIKGATWRIIGTLDTIFLSWLFTGEIGTALKIGGIEVFTKIILFYIHERVWLRTNFGREKIVLANKHIVKKDKHHRSLIKGVSWRIFGTLDTITIAFFVTGNFTKAFSIGFTEVFTKVFLYYLHERIWQRLKIGTKADIKQAKVFTLKYSQKKRWIIFQRDAKSRMRLKRS